MNNEMAYLLGMICGNGTIQRGNNETTFLIDIPHKKIRTSDFHDVRLYVKASIDDIRGVIQPLVGSSLISTQERSSTFISFTKRNNEYITRELLRLVGHSTSKDTMRVPVEIFEARFDERRYFLRGFCDVTAYIRRSNYFFVNYYHRVYIEIPNNWEMVIDISNLLQTLDVPIQTIDWAHPNMRDSNLKKINEGKPDFWKKEHQIKIYANEFLKIGFGILHKEKALEKYASELSAGLASEGKDSTVTHKYYWEGTSRNRVKPIHPSESDASIPQKIRGNHYDSWQEIAKDLGYVQQRLN